MPLPPARAFFILNLLFFCKVSWAKSTTPPLSKRILLKIVLSSVFGPFALNIAKLTYKNLFLFLFLKVLFLSYTVLFKVVLSNLFLPSSPILLLGLADSIVAPLFLANNILLNLFIF